MNQGAGVLSVDEKKKVRASISAVPHDSSTYRFIKAGGPQPISAVHEVCC